MRDVDCELSSACDRFLFESFFFFSTRLKESALDDDEDDGGDDIMDKLLLVGRIIFLLTMAYTDEICLDR